MNGKETERFSVLYTQSKRFTFKGSYREKWIVVVAVDFFFRVVCLYLHFSLFVFHSTNLVNVHETRVSLGWYILLHLITLSFHSFGQFSSLCHPCHSFWLLRFLLKHNYCIVWMSFQHKCTFLLQNILSIFDLRTPLNLYCIKCQSVKYISAAIIIVIAL